MLTLSLANILGPWISQWTDRNSCPHGTCILACVCVCVRSKVNKFKYLLWCIRDKYKLGKRKEKGGGKPHWGDSIWKKTPSRWECEPHGYLKKENMCKGSIRCKDHEGKHVCPSRKAGILSLGCAEWEWEWWGRRQRSNRKLDRVGHYRTHYALHFSL